MLAQKPQFTNAKLDAATVYFNAAELTHSLSANLSKGTNEIVVKNVANNLNESTLRILAPKNVTVLSADNYTDNLQPKNKQIKDSIALLSSQIDKLNKWVRKHRWLYEQEHGAIPENSVIIFADGDKTNLNTDNLICVTRNELKVLNRCRLISSVPELTKTGLNIAKIKIKLAELRKENKY